MEQIGKLIQTDKQCSTDPDEWVLTSEEENLIISNAKKSFLNRKILSMHELGLYPHQIDQKLREYDLEEMFNKQTCNDLFRDMFNMIDVKGEDSRGML